MEPTLEEVLRTLEENAESAKSIQIELTEDYLALIALVEALPENQSGADKSGRWRGSRADQVACHARVQRLPRQR